MKYQHLQSFYKKVVRMPLSFYIFEANRMKNFLLLCITCFLSTIIYAQTEPIEVELSDSLLSSSVVDSTQVLSNVNVFKDPRLDVLKSRPVLVMRNKARKEIIEKRKKKLGASNVKNYDAVTRGRKRVTGSIVTRKGYRVVIYNGSNRTEALNMKRKFMRSYRGVRSYLTYSSPYFKIKVGDFASKTSAYKFLRRIQGAGFSKSFVAPDIVTIKDINVR